MLVWAVMGAILWTFAEYVIHRFDGHGMKGKTPFSREHLAHHADPSYFASSWKKLGVATLVGLGLSTATGTLFGWSFGLGFTTGFLVMYGAYEVVHRRIHTHAPLNAYGRWARRHHLLHHHGNPRLNHGVTSPFWDWVFGTLQVADGVVGVPVRRAPSWLRDPATGRVAEAFAHQFALRGRPPGGQPTGVRAIRD